MHVTGTSWHLVFLGHPPFCRRQDGWQKGSPVGTKILHAVPIGQSTAAHRSVNVQRDMTCTVCATYKVICVKFLYTYFGALLNGHALVGCLIDHLTWRTFTSRDAYFNATWIRYCAIRWTWWSARCEDLPFYGTGCMETYWQLIY